MKTRRKIFNSWTKVYKISKIVTHTRSPMNLLLSTWLKSNRVCKTNLNWKSVFSFKCRTCSHQPRYLRRWALSKASGKFSKDSSWLAKWCLTRLSWSWKSLETLLSKQWRKERTLGWRSTSTNTSKRAEIMACLQSRYLQWPLRVSRCS